MKQERLLMRVSKPKRYFRFFKSASPLHDGAVIVKGGRFHTAGCFLPLSKNPILDKNLGHDIGAALGLTEET
ncbi:MAG: DNA integrity scanning protein DisA nucleotide-binding domain protein [Bdellovibrionales bacterium]